mmetsp:Transcript_26522/g.37381  ORF Transcript_26522/g.37381 Transcript_26522/m.37381 type:complete len:106 (+) Transcript_26522:165-482(+)
MFSKSVVASLLLVVLATVALVPSADAFVPVANRVQQHAPTGVTFMAKKNVDLSDIESRDMTREEMIELNRQNEEIMNMELQMMTGFSLVISLPILYLCWVAFFSE